MVVNYKRIVRSGAMSKSPRQSGLSLTKIGDTVMIEAINPQTRTITSNLYMEIPIEQIDEVINALKRIKYEKKD